MKNGEIDFDLLKRKHTFLESINSRGEKNISMMKYGTKELRVVGDFDLNWGGGDLKYDYCVLHERKIS